MYIKKSALKGSPRPNAALRAPVNVHRRALGNASEIIHGREAPRTVSC